MENPASWTETTYDLQRAIRIHKEAQDAGAIGGSLEMYIETVVIDPLVAKSEAKIAHVQQLLVAARDERDDLRQENAALSEALKEKEQEIDLRVEQGKALNADKDTWKHRAEKAERALESCQKPMTGDWKPITEDDLPKIRRARGRRLAARWSIQHRIGWSRRTD